MGYIEANLTEGEEVVIEGKLHWAVFIMPSTYLLLALFFWTDGMGFLVEAFSLEGISRTWGFTNLVDRINASTGMPAHGVVGTSFLVLALIYFAIRTMRYFTTEIALTNQRVLVKVGFIRRDAVELLLSKVEATMLKQTVLGRLFNFGTVSFIGTGGTGGTFRNICKPIEFHKRVQLQITQRDRKRQQSFETSRPNNLDFEH